MTDKQIISEIKEYFCIEEFVSKPVFDKYGEKAWQFLSIRMLHTMLDFDVKGMEAYKVRLWLKDNYDKLPYSIRLENEMNGKQISWVHLDTYSNINNPKVYLFNV